MHVLDHFEDKNFQPVKFAKVKTSQYVLDSSREIKRHATTIQLIFLPHVHNSFYGQIVNCLPIHSYEARLSSLNLLIPLDNSSAVQNTDM